MPQNVSQHLAGAAERIGVGAASPMRELAVVQTSFEVQRWDGDQTRWITGKYADEWGGLPPHPDFAFTPRHFGTYKVAPYSVTREDNCNAIVQQGWVWLLGGVAGTTMSTKFSATNGRIGVGTSTTAVAWGQTYLQADSGSGSTASYYQLVSGTPAITTSSGPATLVFSASSGPASRTSRGRSSAPTTRTRPGCTSTASQADTACSTGVSRTRERRSPGKRGPQRRQFL